MDHRVWYLLSITLGIIFVDKAFGLTKPTSVKLVNNGYTGVVFAIHHEEPENEYLIPQLKAMISSASDYLYEATKHRAYFREVMILIPDTWEDKFEYQSPENATFEGADAIIAPRNPRFAPKNDSLPVPYTKHYEGCGKRGVHIHLTSEFLNADTGQYFKKGRVLVHEWAHYRWGLFNEYPDPIGDPDFYKDFYYSPTRKTWEPTRCTRGYKHTAVVFDDGRYRRCNGNPDSGYEVGCVSYPSPVQDNVRASIMSGHTSIEQITEFCDGNHNDEAPNKHNRLCGKRSSWDVMREHEDFKNSANPPREVDILQPTFILARTKEIRVVLVLDTSGSMDIADRIKKLSSATQGFITKIAVEGSYVGIVEFDSTAKTLSGLTLIDSEETRTGLAQLIPTTTDGGTCIGQGLELALQVLTDGDRPAAGGVILLVTDGRDGCAEKTAIARQRLVDYSVVVNAVTISTSADTKLLSMAESTGGRSYHQSDDPGSTGLHDALVGLMASGVKVQDRRVEVHRGSSSYDIGGSKTQSVFIDETVGNRTSFEFAYYVNSSDPVISVSVTSPSGVAYGRDYNGFTEDTLFKVLSLTFQKAEPGPWTFTVTNLHHSPQEVFARVYTYPSQEGVDPIIATSELSGSTTDFARGEPLIAFAEVVQGFYPVIGAKVTAIIERPPDEDDVKYPPVKLELLDNGAGADVTKNDGIYSRYFTEFTGTGVYGIKINIASDANTFILNDLSKVGHSNTLPFIDPDDLLAGDIPTIGGEAIHLPGMPVPEPEGSPAPNFTRGISGGSSQVPETPEDWAPGNDVIAPSKIGDLRVTSSSYDNGTVSLEFTAPGDDLDNGNASYYVIRMSTSPTELQNNYSSAPVVNESAILRGNASSPGQFGDHEQFTLSVPVPDDQLVVSYTFAIHAVDEAGNEGEASNLAQATLRGYIPPPVPPTTTTGEPYPTTPEPSPTTPEPSPTTAFTVCPEPAGSQFYDGSCYFNVSLPSGRGLSAHVAGRLCAEHGGHLATINGEMENTVVSNTAGNRQAWIGLRRDPLNTDTFIWPDGTPVTFSSWRKREPNNQGGRENCVKTNFVHLGLWNDSPCMRDRHVRIGVCEKPVTSGSVSVGRSPDP